MEKIKCFINAGHWDDPTTEHIEDPGAKYDSIIESQLVMKIRDEINLKVNNVNFIFVPDSLNLKKSIQWVKERCTEKDLAIDLHLNSNRDKNIRGSEAYHSGNSKIAEIFARKISENLSIPNRGAKHDSQTYIGSLGWLRKLNCKSVVVEFGYLTNQHDRVTMLKSTDKMADGIIESIKTIKGWDDSATKIQLTISSLIKEIARLIKLLMVELKV